MKRYLIENIDIFFMDYQDFLQDFQLLKDGVFGIAFEHFGYFVW